MTPRALLRWLLAHPVAILVVGASVLAIAFPRHVTGTVGVCVLAGAAAVALQQQWPRMPAWLRKPPEDFTGMLVISIVIAIGISVFYDTLTETPDWQMGDWGPQRTALAHLMPSLPGIHAPAWDHTVSTGDTPFELYPSFAYFVVGHLAMILRLGDDLPRALMVAAVFVHIGIAVGTTALAMRIAPKPVALALGLLALVDSGAVAHGGTVGLFRWALLHSAMSLAFTLLAAVGVASALRKPSLSASIAIWCGAALAVATHPAGLIGEGAMIVGLAAVALFASDVPVRRALAAMGHVLVGLALAAFIWMPLAARILAYGEHFPNPLHSAGKLVEDLAAFASPITAFQIVAYAGFLGLVAGLWSRRAIAVFVAATAITLYVGLCDAPYLAFDLAPGKGVARLGTERLAQIARPFLAAAAAYTCCVLWDSIKRAWVGATATRRAIAAAAIGILSIGMLRALPTMFRSASSRAQGETRVIAPDPGGREALGRWAQQQMKSVGPGAWARAMFEEDTHEEMHLTAETGLPTFHLGPLPDMLLRERIEDGTPASLKRFDVRWVIALGRDPVGGDPATQVVFGRYHIQDVPGWDGKFARLERGGSDGAQVTTTKLDRDAVVVELTGDKPALVALGTGFYPRWRATHASGIDEPVYAQPAIAGGQMHVVSAWVKPGKTTFTCDGPLPSDHDGLAISILAFGFAIAVTVVWSKPRWRLRALRRIARYRRIVAAKLPRKRFAAVAIPIGVALAFAGGVLAWLAPAKDVGVGGGLRALATVEARPLAGGDWQTCAYSRVAGEYRCPDVVSVYDGATAILNDAAPSWAFNTPAITASMDQAAELRIYVRGRLKGTYWAGSTSGDAMLTVEGKPAVRVAYTTPIDFDEDADRNIEIHATVGSDVWSFSMVRVDTIEPDRSYLVPPPAASPF